MAKRPVRRGTKKLSPAFNIPEGVDELAYDEDSSDAANYAESVDGEVEFASDTSVVQTQPTDTSGAPPSPQVLGIIKQTVRTLANGDERVDVVLDVEDIVGVDKYEFRISKA